MNKLFVLKDIAYAAKEGGGAIANVSEVDLLQRGAFAVFNTKGELLDPADSLGLSQKILDNKIFQFVCKRKSDLQVVQVPALVNNINATEYQEAQKLLLALELSLSASAKDEVSLKIINDTYTSSSLNNKVNISYTVKAGDTSATIAQALADRINKVEWLEASLPYGGDTLVIGSKNVRDTITVIGGGLLEGVSFDEDQSLVYGSGLGEDVLQMEKDFSVDEGNGNYVEYGSDFFKREMETDTSDTYNLVNILWDGTHSSPTRVHNVMRNRLAFAVPTPLETLTGFSDLLQSLFEEAYLQVEPVSDAGLPDDPSGS